MRNSIVVAAIAAMLYSCATVKVVKVSTNGNEQGIRYALGRPYIQVTPNPNGDGSYSVEVIYLPDQDQTYAVQTSAFLAKNTMEVSVDENGILKKIDWTGNSDGVVSEGLKALGEVAKAEVERKIKEEEEEEAEALAEKKAAEEEVKKLEAALEQKKLDRYIAEKDLATLEATYQGAARTAEIKEKIRQARLLADRIEGELVILRTQLQDARNKATDISASFNEPAPGKEETAYGPVLFQIIETYDEATDATTLQLKAVEWESGKAQLQFRTIAKVEPAAPAPRAPAVTTQGRISARFEQDVATIEFSFNSDVEKIDKQLSTVTAETGNTNPEFASVGVSLTDKKKVKLTIKKQDFPPGQYTLQIHFSYKANDEVKNDFENVMIELIN